MVYCKIYNNNNNNNNADRNVNANKYFIIQLIRFICILFENIFVVHLM